MLSRMCFKFRCVANVGVSCLGCRYIVSKDIGHLAHSLPTQ